MSLKKLLTAGVALSALTLTAHTAEAQQRTTRQAPAAPAPAAQAPAPQGPDQLRLLQRQIDDLRKELYDLEVKYNNTSTEFQRFPTIELSNGRPIFRSRDRAFEFRLEGRVHFDWAQYSQKSVPGTDLRPADARDLNSGTNFRRVRLGALGKFAEDWEFELIGEWGGSGAEASTLDTASIAYTGLKPFTFRVGAFEAWYTMDVATSSNDIKFIERPSIVNLADSIAAGTARKAFEISASGTAWQARAMVSGESYGNAEANDEQLSMAARASVRALTSPDYDVHIGVSTQQLIDPPQVGSAATANLRQSFRFRDRPELRVSGVRLIDTGDLAARGAGSYGLELAGRYKNFAVMSEYYALELRQRNVNGVAPPTANFKGWYVQGAWVITGEPQRYRADRGAWQSPQPRANFKPGVAPGAWEAVARYSFVDLNDAPDSGVAPAGTVRGGEQKIITLGVNWYLNRNVRFMFHYLNVDVDRLNTAGQQIGQKYDAFAIRSQFNF